MKKIIALLLALAMLLCFAGCGANEPADNSSDAPSTDDAKIVTVKEGKLTMATNAYFQPYEYYEGEKIVGIDAEIADAIAKKLGLELEIQDMAFDSIITAVQEGSVDIGLAGMTVKPDRLEKVDFSVSYANGVQVVIVPEDSKIATVDDLFADGATYKAGVQLGTTGDAYASEDLGSDRVTQYPNGNEAVNALLGGDVDCVIIDNEPAKSFVANNEGLKILETTYADEDYAACIKKNNTALLDAVNNAIDELMEDGTIDGIIGKYIK